MAIVLKKFLNKSKKQLKKSFNKLMNKIKSFEYEEDSVFGFCIKFCFIVLFYGLLINFMLYGLFDIKVGINTIVALGIFYYLIKFELPPLIKQCLPTREAK